MAEAVGYVKLPDAEYEKGLADLEAIKIIVQKGKTNKVRK